MVFDVGDVVAAVGLLFGAFVGLNEGVPVPPVGAAVGDCDGDCEGDCDGLTDGLNVGEVDGDALGAEVTPEGASVMPVGDVILLTDSAGRKVRTPAHRRSQGSW